ncbi:MAG TPA: hypothetical protein VLC46_00110 [Thermoanaerobaculia bacterium]|jgi:hypothetical protein|nr:hypothetical protein [Thermoanaerobaculia bacterium]
MTKRLCAIGLPVLFVAACVSGAPGPWSGEVKNSLAGLNERQQAFCRARISLLNKCIGPIALAAKSLALLLDTAPVDVSEARTTSSKLAEALHSLLQSDAQMRRITFMSGEYLHPVAVERGNSGFQTRLDFDAKAEGLRDQIGFFPEGPRSPIEDLPGYPQPQYAVATRGTSEILIRVPVISAGHYLGDITAEYLR